MAINFDSLPDGEDERGRALLTRGVVSGYWLYPSQGSVQYRGRNFSPNNFPTFLVIQYPDISNRFQLTAASGQSPDWQGWWALNPGHSMYMAMEDSAGHTVFIEVKRGQISASGFYFYYSPSGRARSLMNGVDIRHKVLFVFAKAGSIKNRLVATIPNIEATLNEWAAGAAGAYGVIFNAPRAAADLPAYSVHHHTIAIESVWQGDIVGRDDLGTAIRGRRYRGCVDISAWVSRKDRSWVKTLRDMTEKINAAVTSTRTVGLNDYVSGDKFADLPQFQKTVIRLNQIRPAAEGASVNKDIERRRFLIEYTAQARSL